MFIELDRINAHHRRVQSVLQQLRNDVNLSGIFVRDYLLDTAKTRAPEYLEQLSNFRQSHTATIARLRTLTKGADAKQINDLEGELDAYWKTLEPLFYWTPAEKIENSAAFVRLAVLPRRDAVLKIAGEIEKLNNANVATERATAVRRRGDFIADLHRRLWQSLAVGLIVTLVAVLRLRSLERRSDQQRIRAENAGQQMRQLSQQLVAAQEEERKRVSRDLHDQVGQMLTALRIELGRAARLPANQPDQLREALSESKRLVDTILRSVRDLLMGLRPSMLDDFGLKPALEWHVREFRHRFPTAVDLDLSGNLDRLADPYRTAVYRIVQEALTNCARHANATRATVAVNYDNDRLTLTVSDNGVGFDLAARRGMGVLGMEERARELNGTFAVRRRAEGGTEVMVSIPVKSTRGDRELARATG